VAELTPFVVWALSGGRFPLALGVLQILALDIGTDTLSAVALGAEPPRSHAAGSAPARGRLLDSLVARRAFAVLGPIEALFGLLAFIATMVAAGWRPGAAFPGGDTLMAASGATFATVVIGQTANAFACRSTRVWAGRVGWLTNRPLIGAASIELAIAAVFMFVPPIALILGHAPPTTTGWAIALLSAPAVLLADLVEKRTRTRRP
jgi:magnesium-transporting ATPase (P-type)